MLEKYDTHGQKGQRNPVHPMHNELDRTDIAKTQSLLSTKKEKKLGVT